MIKETIIVEGRDDIQAVKAAVDAHVIATGGTHFGAEKLAEIRFAYERTGIIVLTDPDYAGMRIRKKIATQIPGAKHAYLPRKSAQEKGRAGVEYASVETIRAALANLQTEEEERVSFDMRMLFALGLTGSEAASKRRTVVADHLGIGDCNARQFLHRLNRYGITKEALDKALEETDGK